MVAAAVSQNTKDFLHQCQGATESLFDFCEQEIFTYPFPNNYRMICLQRRNLPSKQRLYGVKLHMGTPYTLSIDTQHTIHPALPLMPGTSFITEISNESKSAKDQKTLESIVVTMITNISISKPSLYCHFIKQQSVTKAMMIHVV